MKILWAHSHFDTGGGPKTILAWALGLRELNHEIYFIGQSGRLLDSVIENQFRFKPLGKDRFRPSLIYAYQIYKYGKTISPDVLIGVGTQTCMEAALAAYLLKKPILFIFNVSPRNVFWSGSPRWQFPQISDMIVINKEFGDLCISKYGWDEDKVHYIPERLIPPCHNKYEDNNIQKRICIVRRLDQIKSRPVIKLIDNLQEFLRSNKDITIDIIGDGTNYESVLAKSIEVNNYIDRPAVRCVGYVDAVENKLDQCNLIIGTEKVAIEAIMARKATAIIKDDGKLIPVTMDNIAELSNDNFIGSKVNRTLDDNLVNTLKSVTQVNPEELEKLGIWIDDHYDYKIGAVRISRLLEKITIPKFFFRKYLVQLLKMYLSIFYNVVNKQA